MTLLPSNASLRNSHRSTLLRSPTSELQPRITGLHLLHLLSRKETGDPSVSYPIEFTKIWEASDNPPSEEYKVFLADQMSTVRSVLLHRSMLQSLTSMYSNEIAATLLFFTGLNDFLAFASDVRQVAFSCVTHLMPYRTDWLDGRAFDVPRLFKSVGNTSSNTMLFPNSSLLLRQTELPRLRSNQAVR